MTSWGWRITSHVSGPHMPGSTLDVALHVSFQPLWLIGGNTLMLPYCLLRQLTPSLAPESIFQYYWRTHIFPEYQISAGMLPSASKLVWANVWMYVPCMRRGTVGVAFVPPFDPRCIRVARACTWATCRRGGNLLRFIVVAMVVAEEVCL